MKFEKEIALIEAILYLENDSVDLKALTRISGLSKSVVLDVLGMIREAYIESQHGIELIEIGNGFQFAAKKELWDLLKSHYGKKSENKLSKAAMETLAIIAYSQPVTRGEIENIRGVAADNMIRLLMNKELIKEIGKKEAPGRPTLYGTTKTFLKLYRLKSISELPKLDELESSRFDLDE